MSSTSVPKTTLSADGSPTSLIPILSSLLPSPTNTPWEISETSRVTGGQTNKLYKATFSPSTPHPPVLVRVFGAEGLIDRDRETATFIALSQAGLGPRCLGVFANGRVEEFLQDYRTLNIRDIAEAHTATSIARQMAKIHKFQPPGGGGGGEPGLWGQIEEWLDGALAAKFEEGSEDAKQVARMTDWGAVRDEIQTLKEKVGRDWPLGFCNNDLNAPNIMQHVESGKVLLIDFEYGGTNYRAFDIANHLNEYAGGTEDGHPDYQLFPSQDHIRMWCGAYLSEYLGTSGGPGVTDGGGVVGADEGDVDALVAQVGVFAAVDHWYWGLWAVCMATIEGNEGGFYLNYGEARIRQYWNTKKAGGS